MVGSLAGGVVWAYWPTLAVMADRLGARFPVLAWVPRACVRVGGSLVASVSVSQDLALGQLVGTGSGRHCSVCTAGTLLYFAPLDGLSLPPFLAGLVLLLGGWPTFRWAWPALAFLAFMLPLPFQVEVAMAQPLHAWARRPALMPCKCSAFRPSQKET